MKKTLFLVATGLLGLCFDAQALTIEKVYETESATVATDGSHTGTLINYENGMFTGAEDGVEIYGITFDYAYSNVNSANYLIYMGNNVAGEPLFGLYTTADGGVTGAWKSAATNSTLGAWDGKGTVAASVFEGKDTDEDGSITLTLGLHPTKGTVFSAGTSVTYAASESDDINADNTTAQTEGDLYRAFKLKSDQTDTDKLTVNTNYVTSVTVDVRREITGYTKATNSSGTWSKTFNSSTDHVATAATGNDGRKYKLTASNSSVLSKENIVVGGDSQLYIEGSGLSSEFNIESNIYIGTTSYTENGYNNIALRIGNDTKYIKLSGNLYLVENAAIKGGASNSYNIAGTVTDKVDNVDTQSTLTVHGSGANFTGKVDLKGLVIKNGATFGKTVNVDDMTVSGNIGVGGKITATNLTLNENATLTFTGGTLDVGNSITLSTVTLSDYSKYFDADNLTQTLVSSGGISGWNGAIKSTYEANGTTYNTAIDQVGNNIVLTYAEQTASITTTVVEKHIVDGVEAYLYSLEGTTLTLTVKDSLAGLTADGQVSLSLISEGMMQDILTKLNGTEWVTLNLTDGNGNDIVAGEDAVVAFFNEKGQGYWGENVGNGLQYNVERIPEPTTTTLSLLALAGLAARRRRK